MERTKIVATVGPASGDEATLRAMLSAGLDVARINFSHGRLNEHGDRLAQLRSAAENGYVGVMGDLCGPKIRVAALPEPVLHLAANDELIVMGSSETRLSGRMMTTTYPGLVRDVEPGHRLLIEDGAVRCRVLRKENERLICQCEVGGPVGLRKGINLPDSALQLPVLTANDLADLAWAVANQLDYVALSFIRRAEDIDTLRSALKEAGGSPRIVAKIETPAAVHDIDRIIERSDAILVARGDLGVEMDLVEVPIIQKNIVRRCKAAGIPVIVATQMLQSMTESPFPTRAEVSDVANAILDGADAVMLSAETAIGKHPVAAVECMNRIVARTEAAGEVPPVAPVRVEQSGLRVTSAVARTAAIAAREHEAKAIAVWTRTGNTARLVSKHYLAQPILALAPDDRVCRALTLLSGVTPVRADRPGDEPTLIRIVDRELLTRGWVRRGDMVVIVAGTDRTTAGASDAVILHFVDDA